MVALAAGLEALTGLALVVAPATVVSLLLGGELDGAGVAVARVAGFGLFGLALACLPSRDPVAAMRGLLAYNLPVAAYLTWLAIGGKASGPLLWPAIAGHALLGVLLVRAVRHAQYHRDTASKAGNS